MTDPHSLDMDVPELPDASVKTLSRRFSLVWLVPIAAALIGGWLVVKALTEKGPEITITFKSAEGIETDKTKVKYKDVEIGQVTGITFGEDISHVTVKARLVKEAERFISENTRFWVVRARLAVGEISGLGTLFSGSYIDLDPGKPGKPAHAFTGLDVPPIVTSGMPGRHYILESESRGSLEVGSPVYYRQIRVGELVSFRLSDDGMKIISRIFVNTPYDQYVLKNTRFWNASGFDVKIDANGVRIDTESVASILLGGIAFDIVNPREPPGNQAEEDAVFKLFPQREKAQEKIYPIENYWVLHFNGPVGGLSPGAPVKYQGIQIGEVLNVNLLYDPKQKAVRIPVVIAIETERFYPDNTLTDEMSRRRLMDHLVEKGLRAQLQTSNYVTGQQIVAIDFFPTAKPSRIAWDGKHPELPTAPAQLQQLGERVNQLIARLEKLPIEQIADNLKGTLEGTSRITNSPDLLESVRSLNAAVKEFQMLTVELRTRTTPEIHETLRQARNSLTATENILSSDSPVQTRLKSALDEFASAARALRLLADTLERNPQAILTGKEPQK